MLSSEWTKNLRTAKEKQDFEDVLRNSSMVCDRIIELLTEWEEGLSSQESKIADYDNPSWAAKQAHRNGDRSRIRKLKDMFSFRNPRTR